MSVSMSMSVSASDCLSVYLSICQTIYQAVWRTATSCSITSILPAGVSKPFPPQIYAIPRDLPISRGEGCQSRVQIRPFCPRRPFISLSRVQIVGFCPRRLSWMLSSNCGNGPLCSGCFASGIPQGRHLQMPGRSWRAGKAVWRWKARRP